MHDLRTTVVVDYQNVHLTAHDLFPRTRGRRPHETLVDPLLFAQRLLKVRNALQRSGLPQATLRQVLVYRGEPSNRHDPKMYARSQAQKAQWERDRRVSVTLRPLKYRLEFGADGRPALDVHGRSLVLEKREKGVDVLCALAVVREAQHRAVDLVILASHDSDLEPALDEAVRMGAAKVETFTWHDPSQPWRRQLRLSDGRNLWNTRLSEVDFEASRDPMDYT